MAVDEQTAAEQTLDTEAAPEVKAESGDVLGEADIYISFGNFEKGEALLNTAITAEPTRSDYRLKLLELYKETGKLAAFDEAYKALIELNDEAATAKAGTLRAAIPGAAATPFALDAAFVAEETSLNDEPEFGLDFDLDAQKTVLETDLHSAETPMLDDSALDLSELDIAIQPEATSLDDGFNLNMEDVIEQPSAALEQPVALEEAEEEAITAKDDGFDLDFDLDLGSSTAEPEFDLTDVSLDEPAAPTAQSLDSQGDDILGIATADADDIDEEELGFLSDADEAATKLDLARAYIDMGDKEGARDILAEVLDEGRDDQKREAQALLDSIS